jgi:hypothetical protein
LFLDHAVTKRGLINHVNIMDCSFIMHAPSTISESWYVQKTFRKKIWTKNQWTRKFTSHTWTLAGLNQSTCGLSLGCLSFSLPTTFGRKPESKGKVSLRD